MERVVFDMNEQIELIARRIRELREILDVSAEAVASAVGISGEEYAAYENFERDIPIGVLYNIAACLKVDPTVLLIGEAPRMSAYTIVRAGQGISVERYKGYSYRALAYNYKNRDMEPMIVHIEPAEKAELFTHKGQEFNLVLSGTVQVCFGDRAFVLNEGDSIYFDPSVPHCQIALDGAAEFLTVINE